MKKNITFLVIIILVLVLIGCSGNNGIEDGSRGSEENNKIQYENTDVISSASIATDEISLESAFKESWIIIFKSDITTNKELVLEGDFTKPDKSDPPQMIPAGRNISLYDSDEKQNKTVTYTLVAPKLVIKSKDTKIKGGTFVGDIYVEADGFTLVDTKVEGDIVFTKQVYKETYKIDSKSIVTGVQEIRE